MLFAATSDVFASIGCLSKQVSVTLLVPRRNHGTPVNGSEGNRTPVRNVGGVTYSTKVESHMSDLNRRPTVYKTVALSVLEPKVAYEF